MNKSSENKDATTAYNGWKKEDYQKRDFAAITDATGLILKSINFPVNRRSIICALQGVGNGREEFQASHLVIARRIGHKGAEKTAETSVYRELQALKSFQAESQLLLFDIEQGGGSECRRTGYHDYITPAAVNLVNRAVALKAASPERKKDPLGKVMESIISQIPELLPPYAGSRLAEHASKPKIAYFRRKNSAKFKRLETYRERLSKTISLCFSEFDIRSEQEDLRKFARFIADYAVKTAEEMLAAGTVEKSDLLDMMTTPGSPHFIEKDNAVFNGDGLHISSPSPFFGSDLTNDEPDLPSPAAEETANVLLEAALGYARRGWKIIPLHAPDENGACSCSRGENCHSPGKHPRTARGVKEATADETLIKNWWNRFPGAGIGVACGAESGIICLDVDPRSGGNDALKQLVEQHGALLPPTFEVSTGGGGKHFLFKYPEGTSVKNSTGKIGAGLDIKSDGGFIVAAPSRHASGRYYRVLEDSEPAALPDWLLQSISHEEKITTRNYDHEAARLPQAARTGAFRASSGFIIPDGTRNEKLFKIACAMVGRSEDRAKITAEIERVNCFNCSPPLTGDEIQIIIKSALRYGTGTD